MPLPGLTENDAISQANRLLRAQQIALGEDTSLRARRAAHHDILDILAWMWDVITGPVLTSLGHTTTPASGQPWPRVWWCPVGILGYLPLHGSGHHDDTIAHPQPRTVLRPGHLVLHHHRPRPQLRPDPAPRPSGRFHPDRRRQHGTRHRDTRGCCRRSR